MKTSVKIIYVCCILCLLAGCATSIDVQVQRPAELDLAGASSISIIPFSTDGGFLDFFSNGDEERIARYLTDSLQERLLNSGYFTIIGSKRVREALKKGNTPPCDVYVTGTIYDFRDRIGSSKRETDEGEVESFYRNIRFNVTYKVVAAKSQEVIAVKQRTLENESARYDSPRSVPSAFSMAQDELDDLVRDIARQLEPYTVTRTISLLKDKTKSVDMEKADELVRQGNLQLAFDEFLAIYERDGLFEAGYNAARILEAQGNYVRAEELMQELYETTGNDKAWKALKDIRREIQSATILEKQMGGSKNISF